MIGPETRVCPECGSPAGEERFCSSCGLNLSQQPSVPTRAEWESRHQQRSAPGIRSAVQPAGWYPDPAGGSGSRWWSGEAWTDHPTAGPTATPRLGGHDVSQLSQATQRLGTYYGFAVAGFCVSALALLVYSGEAIRWITDVNDFLSTGSITSAVDAGHARNAVDTSYLLILLADLVTAAGFIPWFFVAYRNVERRGMQLRFTRGWAIGSWFIPFFNLVRPKQIANDLWRGSCSGSGSLDPLQSRSVSPLVHWWWALYLVGGLVFGIGHVVSDTHGSAGDSAQHVVTLERTGFYMSILGALTLIGSLVLLAISAYRITQAQDG